jgi:NitT/TauT family transport system permease protein
MLRKVILPASVPTIMAGLRLGVGRALVGVVVGEFFAGDGGIGFNISYFAGRLGTTDVLASVFVVVVAGVALNVLARRLEKLADSWRADLEGRG